VPKKPIIRRSSLQVPQPSKRKGINECRLLTLGDSKSQNIVLVETDPGAEVELHELRTSESIFVLKGTYELILPGTTEILKEADLVYFEPYTLHGLRCIQGTGRCLVIFAPPVDTSKHDEPTSQLNLDQDSV
jgi:quercetin dioxygenase-like cupin family protein